ncbi:hypothetical protein PHLCEN_2v9012 [Hermanssonia centrifuga]|uniref:Uncharacterized protein n=1 Tax=Hermanssonia centrifuga TaxID=98765 RepID=A0A2R6NSA3_9APHY|nr:hypothetical protein PHLCEN_2v9012 [Hermanssonia centrifuga]
MTTTAPPIKVVAILSSPKSTTTSLAKLAGVYRPRLLSMADIIGIIAFVGHIVHKIVDIVKEIKDAPEDITALRDDAAEIGYLLRQLQQSNALQTVILPSDGRVQLETLAERLHNALRESHFLESFYNGYHDCIYLVRGWLGDLTYLQADFTHRQFVLHLMEGQRISMDQLNDSRQEHAYWRSTQKAERAAFQSGVMHMLTRMAVQRDPILLPMPTSNLSPLDAMPDLREHPIQSCVRHPSQASKTSPIFAQLGIQGVRLSLSLGLALSNDLHGKG